MNKLTQTNLYEGESGYTGFGPLGLEGGESGVSVFSNIISSTVGLITLVGIIWFVFIIATGALGIMSAGGDKAKLEGSRSRITNGIIGLVVIISGLFIINLIGVIFGIPWILDIGLALTKLLP